MPQDDFLRAVANMEQALANALNAISGTATPRQVERILKLIIKKEIVLEFLLEEFPITPPTLTPVDCEECSISYNQDSIPAELSPNRTGPGPIPVRIGTADPLTIRFCPCNDPDRNLVRLHFNSPLGDTNFMFEGSITDILVCSAALNTAEFLGEGSIGTQDYIFSLTIATVAGAQVLTFVFTNQADITDTFTVVLRPTSISPDQRVDIVDCG